MSVRITSLRSCHVLHCLRLVSWNASNLPGLWQKSRGRPSEIMYSNMQICVPLSSRQIGVEEFEDGDCRGN